MALVGNITSASHVQLLRGNILLRTLSPRIRRGYISVVNRRPIIDDVLPCNRRGLNNPRNPNLVRFPNVYSIHDPRSTNGPALTRAQLRPFFLKMSRNYTPLPLHIPLLGSETIGKDMASEKQEATRKPTFEMQDPSCFNCQKGANICLRQLTPSESAACWACCKGGLEQQCSIAVTQRA